MARWDNQRRSDNVQRRGGAAVGSGMIFLVIRFIFSRFGFAGIGILIAGFFALTAIGVDPIRLLTTGQTGGGTAQPGKYDDRVAAVVGSTEDVWNKIFRDEGLSGGTYPEPRVTLYEKGVQSGCGYAPSAVGPFYCPADQKIYLDTSFFDELRTRFRVQGDFPGDYVIAHEVGHHVQNVIGVISQADQAKRRVSETEANQIQVRVELQADCFAGLWASQERASLDPGDIGEAMRAAEAIGDDALQRQAGREVNPDSFTHGTSEQRQRWFQAGWTSGQFGACDTFAMPYAQL